MAVRGHSTGAWAAPLDNAVRSELFIWFVCKLVKMSQITEMKTKMKGKTYGFAF